MKTRAQRVRVHCIAIPRPAPISIQSHQTHYLGLESTLNSETDAWQLCTMGHNEEFQKFCVTPLISHLLEEGAPQNAREALSTAFEADGYTRDLAGWETDPEIRRRFGSGPTALARFCGCRTNGRPTSDDKHAPIRVRRLPPFSPGTEEYL